MVGVNVTLVPLQIILDGAAAMEMEGTTVVLTSMVTGAELAVAGEAQVALEVTVTVTTSLSFNAADVNVAPVPALVPFTCH